MKTIQEILSENLKRIRKNKGYNQQKVGEKAGMLASTYSRIEGMKVTPTIETVDKIAKALEIDIYSLLNDADVKSNSLHDRILRIESLSEYNQKIINLMIDTIIEKGNLERNQDIKMNKRLEELKEVREKKVR
ncbi:helix-turn-helix domain-containing protein [Polaribacter sp.]|uniref:helix-turn-helix domain-containing protein n=1 Tax=Polaribacter sp. TaxID=1920175 RepID=UPI003F6B522D